MAWNCSNKWFKSRARRVAFREPSAVQSPQPPVPHQKFRPELHEDRNLDFQAWSSLGFWIHGGQFKQDNSSKTYQTHQLMIMCVCVGGRLEKEVFQVPRLACCHYGAHDLITAESTKKGKFHIVPPRLRSEITFLETSAAFPLGVSHSEYTFVWSASSPSTKICSMAASCPSLTSNVLICFNHEMFFKTRLCHFAPPPLREEGQNGKAS